MDEDQKKFIPQAAIDTEFFIVHLPILVRCKTKCAVGAVCALLAGGQLAIRFQIANNCTR
jgi:hypothetical protein